MENTRIRAPKDIVRIQFDMRKSQLDVLDGLVDVCGLSSKKELFSHAMALFNWAVHEAQRGRKIASYDPEKDDVETVALPAFDYLRTTKMLATGGDAVPNTISAKTSIKRSGSEKISGKIPSSKSETVYAVKEKLRSA